MTRTRAFVLALAAGSFGVVVGRALPYRAAVVAPASGASAPQDDGCRAVHDELAKARAELAICMAYLPKESTPADPSATAEAPPPRDPFAHIANELAEVRNVQEQLDRLPEALVVKRNDGTLGVHRPEDWPLDGGGEGEILSRKFPNGREYLYFGPDAGPPDDPNAYGTLRDLAGPDGVANFRGRRYRWGVNGRVPPRFPSPGAAEPAEPPR